MLSTAPSFISQELGLADGTGPMWDAVDLGLGNLGGDGGHDENCQHVDNSYGDGHFVACKVVGFWHLDGSGFDSGPGQNTMVPSLTAASHLTDAIYVAGFQGLGYYGSAGEALQVEDPAGTTDSVIDLVHVTMMAWVNPASLTGLQQEGAYGYHQDLMILCKEEAYEMALKSDTSGMPTGTLSSAMKTSGNNNGWAWSDGDGVAPVDTWTHVAASQDGDAGEAKYINGAPSRDQWRAHHTTTRSKYCRVPVAQAHRCRAPTARATPATSAKTSPSHSRSARASAARTRATAGPRCATQWPQ